MKNVKNRIPTKANRVLITPEDGSAPFYATITRADEPEESGTPINRQLLMAMQGFIGNTIVRNPDGSITETNADGDVKTTVRNTDGSVTETFTSGTMSISKTTTRTAEGFVSEVIE